MKIFFFNKTFFIEIKDENCVHEKGVFFCFFFRGMPILSYRQGAGF